MPNKRYDNVQLTVTFGDTLKIRNQNISSGENIAQSLGKISTWYASLVPTGGSSGQFLGWNSDGTAKWVSNPNSDTKVTDTVGTANTYYPAGLTGTTTATGTQVFDTSFKFIGTTGTTSAVGKAQLVLGNSTVSGTTNNKQGSIVVYGSTAYAHTIQGAPTAARTLTLPDKTGTFALTSDIPSVPTVNDAALTLKGAGTTVTTFTANASSAKSLDIVAGSNVTVTADATNAKISIASSHPSITKSTDTTSTASPAHGGTFTVVDSVTREANGHVTKINTKTVTLPADSNTDTLVSQTFASADHNRPLLMSYYDTGVATTTAQIVHRNDALFFNPSSGILRSPRLYLQTTGMPITINLGTLQPTAGENVNVLAVRYKNADGTATHTVYPIGILGNDATDSSANYNSGVRLGSTNGTTIVGAGESSVTFAAAQAKYNDESLYLVTDQAVYMYTNCSNDSTTVTGPWRVGGFTTGTAAITSGRVMITDGTTGGFKASDYTIAKSVPSDAKFSDTVTTVTTSGSGNAVTSITASNGALTVTKGSTFSLSNHTHTTTIAADSGTNQLTLAASTKYKLTTGGTNFIFTTPPNTTYSAGTGLSLSGTTFNHSNSVTAETTFDKSRFKYDTQGHITESGYYVHTAKGTNNTNGWIKIATMQHIMTYDNTPIMLTISQRGNYLTYRLHIQFTNSSTTDPPLGKFIISTDESETEIDRNPRAYMIKTAAGKWDLYIQKKDNYEALAVTEFDVGSYFDDHMTWTWQDVQTADSEITGGTEAERILPFNAYQSRTANTVLAAPNGSNGNASFRKLVAADLTGINYAGSSSAGGAATSANKLNTNDGTTNRPVYFSGGVPVQCDTPGSGSWFKGVPQIGTDGVMEIGKYIDFHKSNDSTADYDLRLQYTGTATGKTVTIPGASGNVALLAKGGTSHYGMLDGDGTTSGWIRTTTNGLLPVQSGNAGSGHSSLGTSSWYFSAAYIDDIHGTLDGDASSANKLNTDAGGTYLPVYFSNGVPTEVTVKNNTSKGTIGWTSGAAANAALVTVNSIAYWNGAYNGTSSNLAYCVKGEFGSIVTKSTTDFAVSQTLANDTNLNNITTPGFYNCGGSNSVTNKPSNVDAFGLNVIHDASGQWYTQILYPNNASPLIYVRNYNGSAWSGWNSIAIGSFLPLSGGTMTGTLTAKGSQTADEYSGALNMNNSNIYGVNSIYTADASNTAAEGIHFYRDATHVDTLWMNGGSLLFVPNRELGTSTTVDNSQKVARFTANPTTGQVVITDGTTGGVKSSGYTIEKSVPSNAVFTDTKVTQTNTTTSADYRVLLSGNANDTTETATGHKSTNLRFNPSSGSLYSFGFLRTDISGKTLDINTLTLSDGTPHSRRFIEKTDGGAGNITNIPVTGRPFLLEVDLIRWASTTDYITRQRFTNAANGTYSYVRYCTNGTWGSWTTRKYTDTDTKVTSSANHYTPATVSGQDKSASASGATAAWSIDVVKGVTLNTDGKGHVTGISVTSGKIPANPNTDTKVNVSLATTSKAYLLATTTTPTSTAAAVTSIADTGVYLGTSAGSLYATSFYENGTSLANKYAPKSGTPSYTTITSITTVVSLRKFTCTANTNTYKTFMVEFTHDASTVVQWFTVTGTASSYHPIFSSSGDVDTVLTIQCPLATSATITFTFSSASHSPEVTKVIGFNFG